MTRTSILLNKFLKKFGAYLFLAPSFILIIGFVYIPVFVALIVSLYLNPSLVQLSDDFYGYYSDPSNLNYIGLGTFFQSLEENGFLPVFHSLALVFGLLGFYKLGKKIKPEMTEGRVFFYAFAVNLIVTTALLLVLLEVIYATGATIRVPLRNYQEIFSKPLIIGDFLRILLNTFLWATICTFFHVVLGMTLAIMLNGEFKGRKFFRTVFILPWAIPSFITALVWRNFVFDRNRGIIGKPVADNVTVDSTLVFTYTDLLVLIIFMMVSLALLVNAIERNYIGKILNYIFLLIAFGLMVLVFSLDTTTFGPQIGGTYPLGEHVVKIDSITTKFFFSSDFYLFGYKTKTIFLAAILTNIWLGVPFMMLSFLASLQSIPNDLYEAAELDGANTWVQFRQITFPNLIPTLRTVVLLGIIWTFNLFNVFFILSQNQTGLGRRENWDIFITYIYYLFRQGPTGVPAYAAASALSFVVFIILVAFSRVYGYIFQQEEIN
jgi:ABC-type sugar transport system permease subunit